MITFDLQARAGLSNSSAYASDVCRALADTIFPFEFQMVCKSAKNSYQLSSLFDDALVAKAMSTEIPNGRLQLPNDIAKEYDAVLKTKFGPVVVEVEKANWEKFLYDLLKAHIYLNHGAEYCCIILPENWAHQHGVINVFQESSKRLDLARKYHCGDQRVLDRVFLIGFQQFWKGTLLSQTGREEMRDECRKQFKKAEQAVAPDRR
jgi:hypothetical protein